MKLTTLATRAAAAIALGAAAAGAQNVTTKDSVPGVSAMTQLLLTKYGVELTGVLGYTFHGGLEPLYCNPADSAEVAKVSIKNDLYKSGMITAEQAKALALCAVPGQIGSGEMETKDGRTVYDITLIPTDKKTYTKIQIDASTGEVINAKQFGGLRGLAGFLRESAERKENKQKATKNP